MNALLTCSRRPTFDLSGLPKAGPLEGRVSEVIGPSPANRAEETLSVADVARLAAEQLKAD
jgi:hypothetical protein